MKKLILLGLVLAAMPMAAQQSAFEEFRKQQESQFNQFKDDKQAEFDAFRRRVNEEYAEFMRKAWRVFPVQEAAQPPKEPEVPPVVYEEPKQDVAPAPAPAPAPQEEEKPLPREDIKPLPTPKPTIETEPVQIAVKPQVVVVPTPTPAPEPIAPVKPKEDEPYKKVSVAFYGTIVTVGFPENDNLHIQ